jgi:phosphoserine phosphatase
VTDVPPPSASSDSPVAVDPLPSWRDGPTKSSIVSFVEQVTTEGSPGFVRAPERIATFDNDGTLWCEQPAPVQAYFAVDRVKALASQHPEWTTTDPFASLLTGDVGTALAMGDSALLEVVMATHADLTTEEFGGIVEKWLAAARHPDTGELFVDMTYLPMLELLAYLRAHDFTSYIVSGGGVEFVRQWSERVYGVPPQQVIGSSIKTVFAMRDGEPVLLRLPQLTVNNDKEEKPVTIHQHIGRRPIAAFGNSVGDQQMLEYTHAGDGPRLGVLVLHDDAAREYAYGPVLGMATPRLGAFTQDLHDQATAAGWTVVSMRDDWLSVFAPRSTTVTAINVLLEPDAAMLSRAEANNARLLSTFPAGFALDAAHRPHMTLLQRFVRTADLAEVYAAAGRVLEGSGVVDLQLEAFRYYYIPSGPVGLAGIVARPSPELHELQQALITAVAPFTVDIAGSEAFVTTVDEPVIDPLLIDYVAAFVPRSTGDDFNPHLTTGIASRDYLDAMLAEPFESFTFSPAGAAVYQLGQYGTAAKQLHHWDAASLRHP